VTTCGGVAADPIFKPHWLQKFALPGLAALQCGHVCVVGVPQEMQKRAPGGLSAAQFEHTTPATASALGSAPPRARRKSSTLAAFCFYFIIIPQTQKTIQPTGHGRLRRSGARLDGRRRAPPTRGTSVRRSR
jgi:hypothetical protein